MSPLVRSRRPAVLRRLHAIDATRVHLTMPWVVSISSLRPFGPRRETAMPRADPKSNLFNHQYTSLVTLAEACKEDLVVVDSRTASRLGSLPRLLLVRSVNAVVRLVDPQTGRIAELHTEGYFKAPPSVCFGVLCTSHRRLAGRRARRRWSMACRSPAPRRRSATTLHQHAIAATQDKSARAKVTRRPK